MSQPDQPLLPPLPEAELHAHTFQVGHDERSHVRQVGEGALLAAGYVRDLPTPRGLSCLFNRLFKPDVDNEWMGAGFRRFHLSHSRFLGHERIPLPGGYGRQGQTNGLFRLDRYTTIGRVPTNAPRAGTWAGEGWAKTLAKAVVVEGAWELISTGSGGARVPRVRLDPSVRIPGLHIDRVRVFCCDARLQRTPATLEVVCIAVHPLGVNAIQRLL